MMFYFGLCKGEAAEKINTAFIIIHDNAKTRAIG
jgi:hypothetical protein